MSTNRAVGLLGVGEGDRGGRVEVQLRDPSFGDHGVPVEQDRRVAVPLARRAGAPEEAAGEA